jgi:hypothetical protein
MARLLYIFLLLPSLLFAQELKTSVSKNPVAVGEQLQITFSIDGDGKNFRAPNFTGLRILSGPNQSTSTNMQVVNGKRSRFNAISFSYYAAPLNEGEITIGAASIQYQGKTIQSKPIRLTITKANPKSKENVLDISDKVYIKAHVNKLKLYQGEQLVVSYKLYSEINLADININKLPELNGFWKEQVETSSRPKVESINGINHHVWEINRLIVTPQRSGVLEIDPMGAKVVVQIRDNKRSRNPFGFFATYQNIEEQLKSTTRKIEVLPLPTNAPPHFNGAVGQYKLKAEVDKTKGKTNEAISYKLTLSGNGNLHLIDKISTYFPSDFEVYDPELTDKTFTSKNGVAGKKIFEHLLIPRYQGNYNIPSVKFSYFDTKSKKYKTIETPSFNIEVAKGKGAKTDYRPSEELQEARRDDLIGIKTNSNWEPINKNEFQDSWLFYLLILIPFIGVLSCLIFKQIQIRTALNPADLKFSKSLKIAKKRLKSAESHLISDEKELFFEEIEKSLWGYFSNKFGVDIALLSKETIATYFTNHRVSKSAAEKFIQILNDCEFCRFAPASLESSQMGIVYQKATEIIIEVETQLKK